MFYFQIFRGFKLVRISRKILTLGQSSLLFYREKQNMLVIVLVEYVNSGLFGRIKSLFVVTLEMNHSFRYCHKSCPWARKTDPVCFPVSDCLELLLVFSSRLEWKPIASMGW